MEKAHHKAQAKAKTKTLSKAHAKPTRTPPSPYVQVTVLFRDVSAKPIDGLHVRIKGGTGAPAAPEWRTGLNDFVDPTAVPLGADQSGSVAQPDASSAMVDNTKDVTTDKDGYALTIHNAARNQPIDVLVKNRHGDYVLKVTVTPTKDFSAFTVSSPEFHIEATTKLTPKESMEQDLNLPMVKQGEVMTIESLVGVFGPFIGASQSVTEQGKIKKDFPETHKEVVRDEKTGERKTKIAIEHHYKVIDNGKPNTVILYLLGSRLNYPKTIEISESRYARAAKLLGCESAAIKAVALTESSGAGFCDNGLPKILYERHVFFRAMLSPEKRNLPLRKIKNEPNPFPKYPNLCLPKQGGYAIGSKGDTSWTNADEGVMHQYERFVRACSLNRDAAIQACSWGAFQVMAFYYKEMGYSSAEGLANDVMQGVGEQFDLFVAFVNINKNAKKALQERDWEGFAIYYNGESHLNKYPALMKQYYEKYK